MSDLNAQILELRNKALQQTQQVDTKAAVEELNPSGITTEESGKSATEETPTQQTETATEQKAETVETPEETPKGWDDTPETEATPSKSTIDWNSIGSAFEFSEVKTEEEFKAKVSELKSKLKTYEEKPYEGVPEEFRSMVEVAKTGDWKDYLANQLIDYTKLDPVSEFENDFFRRSETNPKYFTDGKFDPQKAEEALDAIPEAVREVHGQQMIQAMAYQQAQRKAAIEQKAQAKRQEAERSLAEATRKLGELLPLENYGIKFDPKHSSEIYSGITSSKLTKKHLGGMTYEDLIRSGADMKSVVRTITLAEKGEKMIAFKSGNVKTETRKEILNNLQNVQLNTPGTNLNPETPESKPKTPAEKYEEFLKAQQKRWL